MTKEQRYDLIAEIATRLNEESESLYESGEVISRVVMDSGINEAYEESRQYDEVW